MEPIGDPTSYPGTFWRPRVNTSPEQQKAEISASPNSVDVQWTRAVPDTGYNARAGRIDARNAQGIFRYEVQPGIYSCIVQTLSGILRRFFPQGDWESGTATITVDPASFPLDFSDRFTLQPPGAGETTPYPRGLVYTQKEVVIRGSFASPKAGSVSTSGTAVTGSGTAFTTDFRAGDIIIISGTGLLISSVQSDTTLTVSASPSFAFASATYAKGLDRPLYAPLASLVMVRASDSTTVYTPGEDVSVSPDRTNVQWLSPSRCPQPGQPYALIYTYYPTYQVLDMGSKDASSGGQAILTTYAARLLKPEHLTT